MDKSTEYNLYLHSEDAYMQLKAILQEKHLHWKTAGIETHIPDSDYDIILLSNISDYARMLYPGDDYLQTFKDSIIDRLMGRLTQ